jgi:hypothetical protein
MSCSCSARRFSPQVFAPGIKALQPVGDIDSERFVVLARGTIGLVADLAEPPESGEPADLAQHDHEQREQHQPQKPDGGPADPVVTRDQRQHIVVEPERGEQAYETAKRAEQDAAPAQAAADVGQGAHARHRKCRRLGDGRGGRRDHQFDVLDAEGGGLAVRFLAHAR